MLPVCTLKILEMYSDKNHPLKQKDIIRLLKDNYNLVIERKALGRIISDLQKLDYDICYHKGYYLEERYFTRSELDFLIDSILASTSLTDKLAASLVKKLISKESNYQKRKYTHLYNIPHITHGANPDFFYTIECINDAIEQGKKISFDYLSYGLDKKLHKKRERKYIVNPYDKIISQGRYYLIGNYDKYDNISHYRIDKIANIEILDENVKPINTLPSYHHGLQYSLHFLEHIYMFSGESKWVKLKFKNQIVDQIIDWFGMECTIEPLNEEESLLKVKVNMQALHFWLKQYDQFVEFIE